MVRYSLYAQSAACGAGLVGLIAALWQHIAVVAVGQAVDHMAAGTVVISPGASGLALAWVATALALIVFIGVGIVRLGLKIVLGLDDYDD